MSQFKLRRYHVGFYAVENKGERAYIIIVSLLGTYVTNNLIAGLNLP